jgi:hypothetical protein
VDVHDVKLLNRFLWGFNILLGAGIVVFSFQYLLRAADPKEHMRDFKVEDDSPAAPVKAQDNGDGALKSLSNPVEKRERAGTGTVDVPFKATLKGTLPSEKDPTRAVAFIKSTGRNAELVAYVGEEILQEGKPFDEFRGWMLEAVAKDRAVFINRKNERVTLTIDQAITPPPGGASPPGALGSAGKTQRIGQAYTSETYKSRLLASADSRQVWGMDQDEIEWASQNAEQIMDRDFQVAPYAGGGLRLESVNTGTIGAARGLLAGDVLREVNGQPLNNIADVRTLMNNPAMKQQTGLRLTIERAGKPVVIEYRPLPK